MKNTNNNQKSSGFVNLDKRGLTVLVVATVVAVAGLIIVSNHSFKTVTPVTNNSVTTSTPVSAADANNPDNVLGKVIMSEDLLKATVKAQNLNVYWGGPIVGDNYALLKTSKGINLYYLNAPSLKTSERIISTYPLANAYILTLANSKLKNSVGFNNIDGNSVYYSRASNITTKHVYLGIKGASYQVEIFDPRVDQSLSIALKQGGVTLVQ